MPSFFDVVGDYRELQKLKNKKPRNHCNFGISQQAGDGASVVRWTTCYEPTEPAGETEPFGFKVSPCFRFERSAHSQMLRLCFVQRCRAIKKAIKKVIRKHACNDLFIAFLAPLVAKAGDGNRTHVFSLEG